MARGKKVNEVFLGVLCFVVLSPYLLLKWDYELKSLCWGKDAANREIGIDILHEFLISVPSALMLHEALRQRDIKCLL